MKRWRLKTVLAAGALTMAFSMTAFAGWEQDAVGYWWDNGDGTYPAGEWAWLDGNQDGTAECYYFDASGYMLAGTTTPDGYTVNEGGAWTENGEVQTMQTGQPAAEAGIPSWTVGNLQVKQTGDFANAVTLTGDNMVQMITPDGTRSAVVTLTDITSYPDYQEAAETWQAMGLDIHSPEVNQLYQAVLVEIVKAQLGEPAGVSEYSCPTGTWTRLEYGNVMQLSVNVYLDVLLKYENGSYYGVTLTGAAPNNIEGFMNDCIG